jgi:cysteine desulfuration protein SufE
MTDNIDTIVEDFELLDDWEDRYKYLIELGDALVPISDSEKTGDTKVQGCVSQVWIISNHQEGDDPVITFRGDSDAHIVRGLIAIVLAIFSGKSASQITEIDESTIFDRIHLSEHITPQRSNGLRSMVKRIKQEAMNAQPAHAS